MKKSVIALIRNLLHSSRRENMLTQKLFRIKAMEKAVRKMDKPYKSSVLYDLYPYYITCLFLMTKILYTGPGR